MTTFASVSKIKTCIFHNFYRYLSRFRLSLNLKLCSLILKLKFVRHISSKMASVNTYREIQGIVAQKDDSLITKTSNEELFHEKELDLRCLERNFKVDVGDRIKMFIDFSEPPKLLKIEPWEPLRQYIGKITDLNEDIGFVDEDIVFFIDNGIHSLKLRKGDEVDCTLIDGEYCNAKYKVRCENIKLVDNDESKEMIFTKLTDATIEQDVDSDMDDPTEQQMEFKDLQEEPRLKHYNLPYGLFETITSHDVKVISRKLKEFIPKKLDYSTYRKRFHALIYLEEIEMKISFEKYKTGGVCFIPENKRFSIKCGQVKQLRPPICTGDKIVVQKNSNELIIHRGVVESVREDNMDLKFRPEFEKQFVLGEKYSAAFQYSRTIFKRKHASIDYAKKKMPEQFLFPAKLSMAKTLQLNVALCDDQLMLDDKEIRWFKEILNEEQKQTVVSALRGECRPYPFIIFGPPGTGKTSTLIEIILQIYSHISDCKILVATQSNHAANVVANRLIKENSEICNQLVRLVSNSVLDRKSLPSELLKFSASVRNMKIDDESIEEHKKHKNDGVQRNVELEYLKGFKIIIGTCVGMGVMFGSELSDNYFTHVLIDEAAQCNETEAMIPISFVDKSIGQVIMAGDPLQLSPITLSTHAKNFGLMKSMLERYLEMYKNLDGVNPSERSGYDERLVSKLRRNYRSLPSIMNFYNDQFYDSQLIATICAETSEEACKLRQLCTSILPRPDVEKNTNPFNATNEKNPFGIYFVNVNGKNERLENRKSWSNKNEEEIIAHFIPKLLKMNVKSDDIGVISPYFAQVMALKKALRKRNIRVGTVEEFQGEEKKVILISVVKTSGLPKTLQFIFCPKRLNSAISRARMLVVVFGCGELLTRDQNWSDLIQYCYQNGTYIRSGISLL